MGESTTKEARLARFHAVAAIDRRQDFHGPDALWHFLIGQRLLFCSTVVRLVISIDGMLHLSL